MASSSYTPTSDGVLKISVSAADNLDTVNMLWSIRSIRKWWRSITRYITDFDTNSDLILTIGDTYNGVIESSSDVDLMELT